MKKKKLFSGYFYRLTREYKKKLGIGILPQQNDLFSLDILNDHSNRVCCFFLYRKLSKYLQHF